MFSYEKKNDTPVQAISEQKTDKTLFLSFDFDGCLSFGYAEWLHEINPELKDFYSQTEQKKVELVTKYAEKIADRLILSNAANFNKMAEEAKQGGYTSLQIMIGTNRQSLWRDQWNSMQGGGSCIPVYRRIEKYFKDKLGKDITVNLDGYLLTDTYFSKVVNSTPEKKEYASGSSNMGISIAEMTYAKGYRHSGTIFNKLYSGQQTQEEIDWLWDYTKASLLYHQVQRAAEKAAGKYIDFHFYDDKCDDILKPLQLFFDNNKNLIPQNVKLHFHQYIMGSLKESTPLGLIPIQGTGERDANYKSTLVALGAATLGLEKTYLENPEISINDIRHVVYEKAILKGEKAVSIGLYGAPDVMRCLQLSNPPGLKAYTADHFKYARELTAKKMLVKPESAEERIGIKCF